MLQIKNTLGGGGANVTIDGVMVKDKLALKKHFVAIRNADISATISTKGKTLVVPYKDGIEMLGGGTSSSYYKQHFRYSEETNTWDSKTAIPINFSTHQGVVFNNLLYIFDSTTAYTWDGSTWTQVSSATNGSSYYGVLVVFNDEIYAVISNVTTLYKFDGTAWVSVSTLPFTFNVGTAVVYDGEIHLIGSLTSPYTMHYKWDGNTWTEVATLPAETYYSTATVCDDYIYMANGANGKLYRYSPSSGWEYLMSMGLSMNYSSGGGLYTSLITFKDEVRSIGAYTCSTTSHIIYRNMLEEVK